MTGPRNITEETLRKMSPEELREFQRSQCIFCHIKTGKIPSKKVYEDDHVFAILDINPAAPGHVLLMPKDHYMILPQIPEEVVKHLFTTAKKISHALLRGLTAQGTNVFVANGYAAGQKAQHFILHVIPRKENDGLSFALREGSLNSDDEERFRLALSKRLSAILAEGKPESLIAGESEEVSLENQEESEAGMDQKPDLDKIGALFSASNFSQDSEESEGEDYDEEESSEVVDESQPVVSSAEGVFVASKKAEKYHRLNCPFAVRISDSNRVYFKFKEEAEKLHERCDCVGV